MKKQLLVLSLSLITLFAFSQNPFVEYGIGGNVKPTNSFAPEKNAKDVLFNNGAVAGGQGTGGFVTNPGEGPGGSDISLLTTPMTTLGAGISFSAGYSIAEDFTVPAEGWTINSFQFFGYQTGSTTTSTFTAVYVQIWNGAPDADGAVVWGDLTTNRMTSTIFTNVYRANDLVNTTRPIMSLVAELGTPIVLEEGTYWIQWTFAGTGASGPWANPITITGQQTTGNAKQNSPTGWTNVLDGGSSTALGIPFIINGTVNSAPTYTVTFTVTDGTDPIEGATIAVAGEELTTDASGVATIDLEDGEYPYTVTKEGFVAVEGTATVAGEALAVAVEMEAEVVVTYTVTFTVSDADSNPITDAIITFNSIEANAGEYVFTEVAPGTYNFSVAKEGFNLYESTVVVTEGDVTVPVVLEIVSISSNLFANFKAYPNPFNSSITISNPSVVNRIVITNVIGQKVLEIKTNGSSIIETSSLPKGIYLLTFEAENGERIIRKMVKK